MKALITLCSALLFLCACNSSSNEAKQNDLIAKDSVKALVDTPATKDCATLYKSAKIMDSIILMQTEVNADIANRSIRAFTDYAFYCENDSMSPIYLIKTAQIAMAINNANQAKVVLDRCISNYPKFKNKPAAMFMLGQLYDEQHMLNNEEEAKKIYEALIYEYPKSDWAINAKAAIKLLGKTDEQIVKEFTKGK
ncbi:MAG: tetratricopeptide repeat protein [Bacteroidia bacterium]|jgi:outer membrane protein assembly factor BamD (BamD/ComL family)|nr:tetratricopeptide repeat protein [Sphingobacteriaceae bacterium]MBP9069111.1 tetratricopeptide repeat protein [Bacteroidia bacterium]